jgi:CBS domain containing-hemolysin-like protein
MTVGLLIVGTIVSLAMSGLFSGVETGIYCLNRVRLRLRSEQRRPAALRVAALMERREDLIITMLIGTTLADYFASAFVAALLLQAAVAPAATEVYTTLIMTPLIFAFGNAIPKNWFQRNADGLMYPLAPLLLTFERVARFTGLLPVLRGLTHLVVRLADRGGVVERDAVLPRVKTLRLLREGAVRGGLTPAQSEMIDRVLRLSEVRISRVMIPLRRTAVVSSDVSRDDFLRLSRMAHFSRFPVRGEREDQIVGVLNAYDVLADPRERPIEEHIREPMQLNMNEPVSSALLRMQGSRRAMAIVVNRSGACVGVLTVKDLVEEIVGDLAAW